MKSFAEAYQYIRDTSAENIATRTAIFGAFINMRMKKNLGHDYLVDILAALYGPFDYHMIEDEKIMDMLDTTQYGFCPNWFDLLWDWVRRTATSEMELASFLDLFNILVNGKGDEILRHFNYICQVIRPSWNEYFPEAQPFSELYGIKPWPRI